MGADLMPLSLPEYVAAGRQAYPARSAPNFIVGEKPSVEPRNVERPEVVSAGAHCRKELAKLALDSLKRARVPT
jgi:hypothetical protein